MPSVNIRELRDTRRLKAWLRAGKTVELRERQQVIGRFVWAQVQAAPEHWPDFSGRRHKIFGEANSVGSGPTDRVARPLLSIYADTSFFVSL
jgi:hypothetical protein